MSVGRRAAHTARACVSSSTGKGALSYLFLRPQLRNGLGAPDLIVHVVLLLDGVDGRKVNLHLTHHFYSAWDPLWSVAEAHIDLARQGTQGKQDFSIEHGPGRGDRNEFQLTSMHGGIFTAKS